MIQLIQNLNEQTVLRVLVTVAVLSLAFSALSHWLDGEGHWWGWADSAFQNFSTEMMGAVVTFALFELILGVRSDKKLLITQARTGENRVARDAINEMRDRGWNNDGTLNHQNFRNADLRGANLAGFTWNDVNHLPGFLLEGANFAGANLENANLGEASLQKAIMTGVNLKNSTLWRTNFYEAILIDANFENANLNQANFCGANLMGANFQGAVMMSAKFDENTILPDSEHVMSNPNGTEFVYTKYWTKETNMLRYVFPNQPDFWQPDWAKD